MGMKSREHASPPAPSPCSGGEEQGSLGQVVVFKYIPSMLCFRQYNQLFLKTTLQWVICSGLSLYTGGV